MIKLRNENPFAKKVIDLEEEIRILKQDSIVALKIATKLQENLYKANQEIQMLQAALNQVEQKSQGKRFYPKPPTIIF